MLYLVFVWWNTAYNAAGILEHISTIYSPPLSLSLAFLLRPANFLVDFLNKNEQEVSFESAIGTAPRATAQ